VNEKDRELEDTRRHLVDKDAELAKLRSMQHGCDDNLVRYTYRILLWYFGNSSNIAYLLLT